MLELVAGYVLMGVAILIPLATLAGIVYVLIRPLSLDEVARKHREAGDAGDPVSGPTRPGRPRRVA